MKNLIIAVTLTLATCGSAPAHAQSNVCGPHEAFAEKLNRDYGETLIFRGRLPNRDMMEIYTNPSTGSMSMISVNGYGIACYMLHGTESKTFNNDMET